MVNTYLKTIIIRKNFISKCLNFKIVNKQKSVHNLDNRFNNENRKMGQ